MRVMAAVDIATRSQRWILSRSVEFAKRLGSTVDAHYVRSASLALADIDRADRRLQEWVHELPAEIRGQARISIAESPEEGLVAAGDGYDAMIVGPREPNAIEAFFKGPVAGRVLLKAPCPVLVPRSERPWADQPHLLVGVDLNGPGQGLLVDAAGMWAERLGGRLDLVYAVAERLPSIRDAHVRARAESEWLAGKRQEQAAMAELQQRIPEGCRGQLLLRRGDPEGVIVQLSQSYDLVVVGNRERQGLSGIILGAVSQQVVRRSVSDVLTIDTANIETNVS